jgi:hypothetical protein
LPVHRDAQNRVVLSAQGKEFTFGAGPDVPDKYGRKLIVLSAEPGDEVSLTAEVSALAWPTPFELNFMTGVSPSWRRFFYYRLNWRKRTGARLEMVWRYEQGYYKAHGYYTGKWGHLGRIL